MNGRCAALIDEWEDIDRRMNTTDEIPDGCCSDNASERQCAIEAELAAAPADTMADILGKARIVAWWEQQGIDVAEKGPFLARSLLADLTRMAGSV